MKINLNSLTNLDPAAVRTSASADDPRLADILSSDRSTPVTGFPTHRRHTTRWAVAGTAAVAVALAIVGFSHVGAVTPQAFADWTPQPSTVTPQQKQQLYDDCASLIQDRVVVNSLGQSVSSRGATSVIVDQRGSYHAMLVGSSSMWGLCSNLTGSGGLTGEITTNYTDPDWVVPPDDITVIAGRSGAVFGADGPNDPIPSASGGSPFFELSAGRAGGNVAAVQAVTNMGQTIDASLVDGFWLVYGPIDWTKAVSEGTGHGIVEYILTLRDGQTSHVINDDTGTQCFGSAPVVPDGYACLPENVNVQTAAPFDIQSVDPDQDVTAPPAPMYSPPADQTPVEPQVIQFPEGAATGFVVVYSQDGTEGTSVVTFTSDSDSPGIVVMHSPDPTASPS